MINFFKRIRRTFMEQGKTAKYLKYALGEIALVMIGILLALQVNNWNESRRQARVEKEFIEGVKNDLRQDKEYISLVTEMALKKREAADRFNEDIYDLYANDRPALDSVLNVYMHFQRTFYPIYGSFESAISGNEFSQFKNKKFTSAVTKLYNSIYARLEDNAQDVDARWHWFTKKYSRLRRIKTFPDSNPDILEEFLDDVNYHIIALDHYRRVLTGALKEIDVILTLDTSTKAKS